MIKSNDSNISTVDEVRLGSHLTLTLNGDAHNVSNLCAKVTAALSPAYPKKAALKLKQPVIDLNHSIKLWERLPRTNGNGRRPGFHRASTYGCDEKIQAARPAHTRRPVNRAANASSSPSSPPPAAPSPASTPCNSIDEGAETKMAPSTRVASSVTPGPLSPPARQETSSPCPFPTISEPSGSSSASRSTTPTAPATAAATTTTAFPRSQINRPGPRPKVNYRSLYGASVDGMSDSEIKDRERTAASGASSVCSNGSRNANRAQHQSFQEQQLQRTRDEEERLSASQTSFNTTTVMIEDMSSLSSLAGPPSTGTPPGVFAASSNASVHSSRTDSSKTVMEIAPNLFVPYKGSQETWEALQTGDFTVTTCFACTLPLVVMDTAEYLVCPDCHTVSPLSYSSSTSSGSSIATPARCGVGLGIKREWCEGAIRMHQGGGADKKQEAAIHKKQEAAISGTSGNAPEHNSGHVASRRATFLL